MKKILFTLVLVLTTLTSSAMSYEQAREQALFLTDKMAYELDLTEEQYEAAYEVNLDYLMNITTASDVYSDYWTRRNLDLSYILFDWQYRTFCGLEYFYRPIYWGSGAWHFRIFGYYPHTHFYFGRPACFYSYRGGHAWHMNGGHSWYRDRHFARHDFGMRGGWDRGGYRKISHGWSYNDGRDRGFVHNSRPSNHRGEGFRGNTRHNDNNNRFDRPSRRDDNNRGGIGSDRRQNDGNTTFGGSRPDRTFGGHTDVSRPSSTRHTATEGTSGSSDRSFTPSRTFGGHSSSSADTQRPSRSFSGSSMGSGSSSNRSSRTFGSGSSSSRSSSSFGGGSSSSSRSFGGGSSSSRSFGGSHSGGGHSGGGGGHFGGGRR